MKFITLFFRAAQLWMQKESDQYAAALSYFVPFALTPLLLISLMWVNIIIGSDRLVLLLTEWGRIVDPNLPTIMGDALTSLTSRSQDFVIPLIGVAFFSVMILVAFNSLTSGIHKLWSIEARGMKQLLIRYMRAGIMIILIQAYFVFLIVMSGLVAWFDIVLPEMIIVFLRSLLFLIATSTLVMFGYRILPVKTLPLRSCIYGALVAGVMFYGLRAIVAFHIVTAPAVTFYGAASIIIVLLIWFYAVASVILYGAAFAKAHAEMLEATT